MSRESVRTRGCFTTGNSSGTMSRLEGPSKLESAEVSTCACRRRRNATFSPIQHALIRRGAHHHRTGREAPRCVSWPTPRPAFAVVSEHVVVIDNRGFVVFRPVAPLRNVDQVSSLGASDGREIVSRLRRLFAGILQEKSSKVSLARTSAERSCELDVKPSCM